MSKTLFFTLVVVVLTAAKFHPNYVIARPAELLLVALSVRFLWAVAAEEVTA